MSRQTLIDELQDKRLGIDMQIRHLQAINKQVVKDYDYRFNNAIHALELSKGFLGKMVGALDHLTPYIAVDKAAKIPPTAQKAEEPTLGALNEDGVLTEVNKIRAVVSLFEEKSFELAESFWTSVDDSDIGTSILGDESIESAGTVESLPIDEDKVPEAFYEQISVYISGYMQWIITASMELGFIIGKIREAKDAREALHPTKQKTPPSVDFDKVYASNEIPSEAHSLLIRTHHASDTETRAIYQNGGFIEVLSTEISLDIKRYTKDEILSWRYANKPKTPPCVGHDKENMEVIDDNLTQKLGPITPIADYIPIFGKEVVIKLKEGYSAIATLDESKLFFVMKGSAGTHIQFSEVNTWYYLKS